MSLSADKTLSTVTSADILELQLSKENYVWELVSDSGENAVMPKMMDSFLAFMKEKESFSGGNTELAEAFTAHTGERVEPKRLKQMMNVWRAQLLEQGVTIHSHRSNGQRLVDVQYTPPVTEVTQVTQVTQKNRPLNLASLAFLAAL